MSLPSGLFDNEDEDSNTLSLGEVGNTPFYETTTRPERDEGAGVKTPTITFDASTLGSNERVIMSYDNLHDVKWTIGDSFSISVVNASWQGQSDDKGTVGTIKFAKSQASTAMPHMGVSALSRDIHAKRESAEFEFLSAGGGVRLPVNDPSVSVFLKKEMHLVLGWSRNDGLETGYTQSGLFTVYNGTTDDAAYRQIVDNIAFKVSSSDADSSGQDIDRNSNWAPKTTTGTSSLVTSTSAAASAPSSTATTGASPNSNSSSGGGGGLSAGAIAGIVIGSILGAALIAFLLWFLLRRRRRANNVHNGGYGSGPHEFLADKETHARVTESPHSPYSDDGHQQQEMQQSQRHLTEPEHDAAVPSAAAAAAAVLPASGTSPTERRSFAPPYSEEEHTPIASRSLENVSHDGARSSTPNVNSNVSHLIEDGMTEDEIRRLEEEERALDAAIEQAGQGGGQGQRR